MLITKNNKSFNVKGSYSEKWFSHNTFQQWEPNTFHILDYYQNLNGTYIDIGAWIGPTAMYASQIFGRVVAVEPDKLAYKRLVENLSVNHFNNITLVDKCLSDKNEKIMFGGNGKWGNSESTTLVSNPEYSSWGGLWSKEERESNIKEVESIDFKTLIKEYNIEMENVKFIKMDIEGGEMIAIPGMKDTLRYYKPTLYISLHFCFLKTEHIESILDILFSIYDICYLFYNDGSKIIVDKKQIIDETITSVVFE